MDKFDFAKKETFSFEDLRDLVAYLRSPEGCPWDREQSHESIRNHFVEEAYEVCEGIDKNDAELLKEELGDMLFQVLFHVNLAEEDGKFTMDEVLSGICKKMIFRHPFLFDPNSKVPEDQIQQWELLKQKEKGESTILDSLKRISTSLPALKRAEKFSKKGAKSRHFFNFSPLEKQGKKLYKIAKKCQKSGMDPEQALNAYLTRILEDMHKN